MYKQVIHRRHKGMKRVSKTAAGILAALVLGVSSLGVSRVWAQSRSHERGTADTRVGRSATQTRAGQHDIDTTERLDLDLDVRTETAEVGQGSRELTLAGGATLRQLPQVQGKSETAIARTGETRTSERAEVVAQRAEQRRGLAARLLGIASFNKGERFDGQEERAQFTGALVPAQGYRQEAAAATSLHPDTFKKDGTPAFNGRLAVDAALISSTGVAAYTNVITDNWQAIVALLGLGAFWVFFAGPANAWQIISTLPAVVSHATSFGLNLLSHGATFLGNLATSATHVSWIAYAHEWALKGYAMVAGYVASGLTHGATFFHNLATAIMPNVHFVTSFPTVMSYAPYAAWGYGAAAVIAGGWYRADIMNTFSKVSNNFGYVLGGVAATLHAAVSPFLFVAKVANEVIRPVIRPIWDFVKDVIWPPVKELIVKPIGRVLRGALVANITWLANMIVTPALLLAATAVSLLSILKDSLAKAWSQGGLGGVVIGAVKTLIIFAGVGALGYGIYMAPAAYVRYPIEAAVLLLGTYGAIHGFFHGVKYGFVDAFKQSWDHKYSAIEAAEGLLAQSWKKLTA